MSRAQRSFLPATLVVLVVVTMMAWFLAARARRAETAAQAAAAAAQRELALALRRAEERNAEAEPKKRRAASVPASAIPAPASTDAKPVASPQPRSMAEIIAGSPALELLELQRQHAAVKQDYEWFFRQRGLSPEQIGKFRANWVKHAEAMMDLRAAGRAQGKAGEKTIAELQARATEEYEAAQRELLGPEGFQSLKDYERAVPLYNIVVRGLAGALAIEGIPLSPEQGERLLAAAVAGARGTTAHGDIDLKALDWSGLERQAQQILTPAQFAMFQNVEPPSGFRSHRKHQLDAAMQRAWEQERTAAPGR